MLRDRQNRCLSQFKSISHISLGSAEAAAASFHIHRAWPLSTWSCCALRVKVAVKIRMMSGDSTDRRPASSSSSSSSTWVLINALKTKRPPSRFAPKRNALTPLPSPPLPSLPHLLWHRPQSRLAKFNWRNFSSFPWCL